MIDLHTHSTESDGSYTPAELIKLAASRGITLLALTDHDTISGNKAAGEQAAREGIRFIPGIELEIQSFSGEMHLLGLGITRDLDEFTGGLFQMQNSRSRRNHKILQKMQAAGFNITVEDINAVVGGSVVGRPHFARVLVNRGIVKSVDEAFRIYLGTGKPFYVEKATPSLAECIALIKKAGGISVLAHPVTLKLIPRKLKEFLLKCKKKGLDGIEVYHPDHKLKVCRDLERFGMYNKFIITGGSDFHGTNRRDRKLGYVAGDVPIPERLGQFFCR